MIYTYIIHFMKNKPTLTKEFDTLSQKIAKICLIQNKKLETLNDKIDKVTQRLKTLQKLRNIESKMKKEIR